MAELTDVEENDLLAHQLEQLGNLLLGCAQNARDQHLTNAEYVWKQLAPSGPFVDLFVHLLETIDDELLAQVLKAWMVPE